MSIQQIHGCMQILAASLIFFFLTAFLSIFIQSCPA